MIRTATYDDSKFKIVPIKSNGAWIDNLIKKNGEPSVEMTISGMHNLVNELLDAAPEYQEPQSAIAPDPRMNEPWTDEEKTDLKSTLSGVFNWNQEPTKDEL